MKPLIGAETSFFSAFEFIRRTRSRHHTASSDVNFDCGDGSGCYNATLE